MKRKYEFPPLELAKNTTCTAKQLRDWFRTEYERNKGSDEFVSQAFAEYLPMDYATAVWKENKQVYSFERAFLDVLMTSPLDIPWEIDIFKRMPYSCFVMKTDNDEYALIHFSKENDLIPMGYIGVNLFMSLDGKANNTLGGVTFPFDNNGIARPDSIEKVISDNTYADWL